MPIFNRPDGTLVKNESLVRRFMPFMMRGRNESCVYHEAHYDIGKTRAWLRAFNHRHDIEQPATLFHWFLWTTGQGLCERPGLNRFVSGGNIYDRKGVYLTFSAKKAISDDAPLVTVKMKFWKGEPFADCVKRIVAGIKEARTGAAGMVDKELTLALALPGWMLSGVMAILGFLDRVNLMPGFMIETDPMYTSAFVSNLGSVGLDRTTHHLYEYGTAGMFAALGAPRKQLVADRAGKPEARDILEVRWTLDERVNDGLYCARTLAYFKKVFENPEDFAGGGDVAALATRTPGVTPSLMPSSAPP